MVLIRREISSAVDELAEYKAYYCALRETREMTIEVNLVTINFCREQWVGRLLPLDHFRIKVVKEGIK